MANATLVTEVAEQRCLGQHSCSVPADVKLFGKGKPPPHMMAHTRNRTRVVALLWHCCGGDGGVAAPVTIPPPYISLSLYSSPSRLADPCPGVYKSLAVSVRCAVPQCDIATENWPAESTAVHVGCPTGETIHAVLDAQFGVLSGNCSAGWQLGCHADPAVVTQVVQKVRYAIFLFCLSTTLSFGHCHFPVTLALYPPPLNAPWYAC